MKHQLIQVASYTAIPVSSNVADRVSLLLFLGRVPGVVGVSSTHILPLLFLQTLKYPPDPQYILPRNKVLEVFLQPSELDGMSELFLS
jgi:hypothetical protein